MIMVFLLLFSLAILPTRAEPFNLDTTFGNYGIVTTFSNANSLIQSLATNTDNKILAGGFISVADQIQHFYVARYNADGILDTTFVGDTQSDIPGTVITPIGTSSSINDITLQADGMLVAAGVTHTNSIHSFALARYTTTGLLDTTFNGTGIVLTSIDDYCACQAVTTDTNGNILVTGFSLNQSIQSLIVARYTPAGQLDATFGTNGIVRTTIEKETTGNTILVDASGNIVVGGYTVIDGIQSFIVIRYLTDGTLDTTFGTNGIVITNTPQTEHCVVTKLLLQSDQKIIAVGHGQVDSTHIYVLARYTTNGTLDNTFGSNGFTAQSFANSSDSHAHDARLVSGDTIIIAGTGYVNFRSQAAVARFTADGILDATFGIGGSETTEEQNTTQGNAVTLTTDGKIIVGGSLSNNFALARFNPIAIYVHITTPAPNSTIPLYTTVINGTSSHPNATVEVTIDNDIFATVQTDGSGNWSTPVSYELVQGIHTVRVTLLINSVISALALSNFSTPIGTLSSMSLVWDQRSTGTNAGTFTGGSFITRILNNALGDPAHITLSNNQITILPGTYLISISAPAYNVGNHQIRLQNVTDGITEKYGSSGASSVAQTHSCIEHRIVLNTAKTFEIQHWAENTRSSDGLGIASGIAGNVEIYTQVRILRL